MRLKRERHERRRSHRPVDDRSADLEARIAAIKARETAKQAKKTPEGQVLVLAVRALDKAGRVAVEAVTVSLPVSFPARACPRG